MNGNKKKTKTSVRPNLAQHDGNNPAGRRSLGLDKIIWTEGTERVRADAAYLGSQAVVLCAHGRASDIDYIQCAIAPYSGETVEPPRNSIEGFALELRQDIERIQECVKSGDLDGARLLCVNRTAYEMAGHAAVHQGEDPRWIDILADTWGVHALDFYGIERDPEIEPLAVLGTAVGRSMFLCRIIHRPDDPTAGWDQEVLQIFKAGCMRAVDILKDERAWDAVKRLAEEIRKYRLLAGDDVRRAIDGGDGTLEYLQGLTNSTK